LDDATKRRWYEFDRPEARRISHVVVKLEGTREEAAMTLARQIAKAVRGIRLGNGFLEAARAVPTGGLSVVAEALPPALEDGRVLSLDANGKPNGDGGSFDEDFVRAAFQLKEPGDQSGVIRTRFGFHVLLFVERIPRVSIPVEERRKLLAQDVWKRRAQIRVDEWIGAGRKALAPSIERAALELTSRVKVAP
jgi:parvulin-like peptidyl-prolyl isomerase